MSARINVWIASDSPSFCSTCQRLVLLRCVSQLVSLFDAAYNCVCSPETVCARTMWQQRTKYYRWLADIAMWSANVLICLPTAHFNHSVMHCCEASSSFVSTRVYSFIWQWSWLIYIRVWCTHQCARLWSTHVTASRSIRNWSPSPRILFILPYSCLNIVWMVLFAVSAISDTGLPQSVLTYLLSHSSFQSFCHALLWSVIKFHCIC